MNRDDCPGDAPFVCIGGYLYSTMSNGMMIFPTNRKCPRCHPEWREVKQHTIIHDGADLIYDIYGASG